MRNRLSTIAFALSIIGLSITSCEKDVVSSVSDEVNSDTRDQIISKTEEFAKILSEAVSNNIQFRSFIKETALKQFDKDYDVFYPFVKDEYVEGRKTFRDIILDYCTEAELSQIELAIPKLNILVPDWSWFGGPCAENWDTNSDDPVFVGFEQSTTDHTLYCKGENAITLSLGEFPSSPTLIVKDNERMKVTGTNTRSSGCVYDFVDPAFDGRRKIETKGRAWYEEYINLPYETMSDFVPTSDISPILVNAYGEFGEKDFSDGCQRDYVYYSMTHANNNCGISNDYIRERLYRFRVSKDSYARISDQAGDPTLSNPIESVGKHHELSTDKLIKKIWSGGAYEFRFDVYIASEGGNPASSLATIPVSASGSSVFDLARIYRKYKHNTKFAQGVSVYSFLAEDLVPKWVYPDGLVYLPKWDIAQNSNNILIVVNEYDSTEEITETDYHSFTFSKNFGWKVDVSAEGKVDSLLVKGSLGLNGGRTKQTTENKQINVRYAKEQDLMGRGDVPFTQRIIERPMTQTINGEDVVGYSVRPVSLGDVSITLLPEDIRR